MEVVSPLLTRRALTWRDNIDRDVMGFEITDPDLMQAGWPRSQRTGPKATCVQQVRDGPMKSDIKMKKAITRMA